MDPLSCLSIATGIITFVDFGSKLISLYAEVRESDHGRPAALSALETESRELSTSATLARDKVSSLQARYPRQSESLARLTAECTQAEKELRSLTESLTTTVKPNGGGHGLQRGAQAMLVSIRSMRKKGDLDALQDRLRRIREQTMMSVMLCILEDVTDTRTKLTSVDHGVKDVLGSLRPDLITTAIENLQPEFHNISHNRRPLATDFERNKINEGLWASLATAENGDSQTSTSLVEQLPESDDNICKRITKSLEFDTMRAREEQITEHFPETFQWLLAGDGGDLNSSNGQDSKTETRAPTKFTAWLESQAKDDAANPYWITGKAASGKSTLMKFICNSPQVNTHLRAWAGQSQLLICSVYFWNPGSSAQKNHVGLLRTMLHQLLSQRPDLCRHVALRRYLYFQLAGMDSLNPPDWTVEELQDCLVRFISEVQDTSRLAIFIDGLDEYEGNPETLITFLKHLHNSHKIIKLCISSRPWNVFRDAFCTYPSLTMELFTKPDIEKYVYTRIGTNRALQELRALDPTSVHNLESQIINRAEGVFLWVVLVTEKVIATACDNNDLVEIWEVFETLPPGLEELYNSMLSRLEPDLREKASRMYQLLFRWNSSLDRPFGILEFWVATNCRDPTAQVLEDFPTNDKIPHILPLVERRLSGATGGILQVQHHTKPTVGFIHRTVFEWLQNIQPSIASDGPPDYDPVLVLTSVLVSSLKQLMISDCDALWKKEVNPSLDEEIFTVGRSCKDTTESRAKLLSIIQHLKIGSLSIIQHIKIGDPQLNSWTDLLGSQRGILAPYPDSTARSFLAVALLCPPYLQAELESTHSNIEGLKIPRILQSMPPLLWDKPRRGLVTTLVNKLLDKAVGTENLQFLNTILSIFEILVRAQFAPCRVLRSLVKEHKLELRTSSLPTRIAIADEFHPALLDGLAGKGFSEISSITPRFIILPARSWRSVRAKGAGR